MTDVILESGTIVSGEKIDKLVEEIINKFADEKLSVSEAKIVLEETKGRIEEFSRVTATNSEIPSIEDGGLKHNTNQPKKILYLCNGKKECCTKRYCCKNSEDDQEACRFTTDIRYAKNFKQEKGFEGPIFSEREGTLKREIVEQLEGFVKRVAHGGEDASMQEIAILPEILKILREETASRLAVSIIHPTELK